ncbi:MAG: hypothetical protein AABY32_01875 [Nanoarchaeota archaeon]
MFTESEKRAQAKEKILKALNWATDDDLERAEMSFKNFTPAQMKEQHGSSGKTRQEILDEYRREREQMRYCRQLVIDLIK